MSNIRHAGVVFMFMCVEIGYALSPSAADSTQRSSVGAAAPHVAALRQELGLSPNLRLELITSNNGTDTMRVVDDFNRSSIGNDWALDGRYWAIKDGELTLTSAAIFEWRYLAVFKPIFNTPERRIYSVAYRWGKNAETVAIGEGAFALMVTEASPYGSGYWCWRRTNQNSVWLYAIKDGTWEYTPGESKEFYRAGSHLPIPRAGDYIETVIDNQPEAAYFDYYINGGWDATVYDGSKEFAQNPTWYAGVFIHGQDLHNEVDDFTITWLGSDNVAPATVTDLRAIGSTASSVTLQWTSPGDNYFDGRAARLEIRYSSAPLTAGNFSAAALAQNIPAPANGGETQQFAVEGLNTNTQYYFALRAFDEVNNASEVSNVASALTTNSQGVLLSDDFTGPSIDVIKWNKGSNSGNQAAIESGALKLQSSSLQAGWIVTKNAYAGANKIAKLKITQPNDDGDLGMSPTVNLASTNALYGQNNWYRFYIYRDGHAGNYLLFAQWKRNGAVGGKEVTNGLALPNNFYLRLRTDSNNIFFEYSPNDASWTTVYQEPFGLPGYALTRGFYFEISGNNTAANGILRVDDFNLSEAAPPPDTQPPVISQVASGTITSTGATITWATDELSDSQVEHGLTTAYGSSSPLDALRVTNHSVALNGLSASTSYHYRVKSRDAASNLATSNDFTFTTTNSSTPIFSDNFTGNSLDANNWNKGTNSGNQSQVANNVLELRSAGAQTGWIITKNNYTARSTAASVKITGSNDDGNLGMTPTYSLTSTNGVFNEATWYRFYVYRDVANGPYLLFVQWKKNGVVDGLDVTGNAVLNGAFYMRMRCDDTRIYFEYSSDGQAWAAGYSEAFGLSGYALTNSFYYELAAYRTDVKGILKVDDFAINSVSPGPDTQPPVISQVTSGDIGTTTATITWNTDEAADSQVEYGTTTSYGSSSPLNSALVTTHSATLSNLAANTTFHYRVKSKDANGNLATSNDFIFATASSTLFFDNFNIATLDLNNWVKGSNTGNQASVVNNALELRSTGTQTGWVVTKNKYAARNTSVTVKVVQPNNDGDVGMTPTVQASSTNGIYNQANWYRFYVYRDVNSGPYRLYVQWSKGGAVNGLAVTGNLNITGVVYLRLRFDDSRIHFEAALDGQAWTDTYSEVFALPGYTLDNTFNFELAAYWTDAKGRLTVDDFTIATTNSAPAQGSSHEATIAQELPTVFALSQNYPNPFYSNTHARLALPEGAQVHAVIYDISGREIQQLYLGPVQMGYREIVWDGTNTDGQGVSSGVYFLRVIFATPTGHRDVLTRQLRLMR